MMQFIYAATIIAFILLVTGFRLQNEIFASMGCMMLTVIGVYIISNGFFSVHNYLTDAIAYICILLGSFMFININTDIIDGGLENAG